ncbi:MAG: neutral zinc metallopeptidase [Nocardioidaceae bacterium]|nr:neutral zinc metallopeptidase [Nocardioidaceae bacterium]
MKFNPKARLDRSQMRKRGRGGSSGGGGFQMPSGRGSGRGMPIPMGGGVVGLILVIVLFLVVTRFGSDLSGGSDTSQNAGTTDEGGQTTCESGADANERRECALLATVNSVQDYWGDALPDQGDVDYEQAQWQDFSGTLSTGCGQASSATGPFYCPVDKGVYLDQSFFDDMLEGQLGAKGGDFAESYVVAHEYGHHVQDLLGTLSKYQSRETGPTSPSVRIELQADCYAGLWAQAATTTKDSNGEVFITDITQTDIGEAIDAATAVGDDKIQRQTSGRVNPEQWTHGSAEERVRWFMTGFDSGRLDDCDTFSTDHL